MVKQKWLWGIVLLLLILSLPGLVSRWDVESSSPHYEIIIPYEEMLVIEEETDKSIDEIISELKEAGLTTVNLGPVSLEDLEEQQIISVYSEKEMAENLQFTSAVGSIDVSKKGYYITIPETDEHKQLIEQHLSVDEIIVGETRFYFLPKSELKFPFDTKLGYDPFALQKIREHNLLIALKVENSKNEAVNNIIVNQLVDLKEDDITGLIGQGKEIIGFGHEASMSNWFSQLREAGYYFYMIESNPMKGENHYAKFANYETIRLLSIDPIKERLPVDTSVDRTVRAIKERNIKSIYFHIDYQPPEQLKNLYDFNAEDNFQMAVDYLTTVQETMPDRFTLGQPELFDRVNVPSWVTALVLLAGIIFTFIVFESVKVKYVSIGAAVGMALLAVAYFVLNRVIFLQGFALIISIITPIYAVVVSKGSQNIGKIFVQYVKALAISLIGIWIIVGLLNGNAFITGFEQFRGVKLVYVIPIAVTFLYALSFFIKREGNSISLKALFNKEVKYGHVLILLIVAAIAYFYIGRTGNEGSVSTLELAFRQWLEDTLYVRPRTKEFLIGFPFFVLALYVMGINRKWGSILLIPGVIGLLSIVNTFTHFHIPLEVSLLRTLYGAVLGFVIGLVFIILFNLMYRMVRKYFKFS